MNSEVLEQAGQVTGAGQSCFGLLIAPEYPGLLVKILFSIRNSHTLRQKS